MHSDKALRPDGFNLVFYQKFWHILGDDVYNIMVSWLTYETFPDSLNETHIALIPKCDNPEYMKDLRPISLCNVIYKIMAKMLANCFRRKTIEGNLLRIFGLTRVT